MIEGTEFGPRYAEIGNWVGKALYAPRVALNQQLLSRSEFSNPGVYFLKSKPNSDSFSERIYIGEAEIIRERLKTHLGDPNKDFEEVIFFISKDDLLTKTQIRYLESRLVKAAKEAKSAEIDNTQVPSFPTLHEADISDMDYFFEQMKLIFPLMGFNFLKPSIVIPAVPSVNTTTAIVDQNIVYKIKSGNYPAFMYETDQGFVVKKGSKANKQLSNSITDTYRRLQHKLIESGILVDAGNYFEFADDAIFNSTSAASNIVLGRQSQGPAEWVNTNGITYKEISGY